jgi:hypothetical protein
MFAMIKEVIGVEILTDKGHQVYKPKKGQLQCSSILELMHLIVPLKDHLKLHLAPVVHLVHKVLQIPVVLLLVLQRRREFIVLSLKVSLHASMWVATMQKKFMPIGSMWMSSF